MHALSLSNYYNFIIRSLEQGSLACRMEGVWVSMIREAGN